MNTLKRTLKWGLLTVVGLIAILYITDTDYLLKAVRTIYAKGYTTAFLEDYKEFDNAENSERRASTMAKAQRLQQRY
jgi:hypothetical protein